jgi:hypothetical protein
VREFYLIAIFVKIIITYAKIFKIFIIFVETDISIALKLTMIIFVEDQHLIFHAYISNNKVYLNVKIRSLEIVSIKILSIVIILFRRDIANNL